MDEAQTAKQQQVSANAIAPVPQTTDNPVALKKTKLPLIPAVAPTPVVSTDRVNTVFYFPKNISVGMLKVDKQPPKTIVGQITVGKKSKVIFYTRHASKDFPDLLDKFRDDDLNGLEACFKSPEQIFYRVRHWKRLEELSFFDSLIKAMPRAENHDQTPIRDDLLPAVDKLTTLTSLGLCGSVVSGECIAKMSLLRSLHTIKLKIISNIEPLLTVLPQHNNIEEVWLIDQKTDNHQLEILTGMENLKSLTIRRSELKPDSLAFFLKMKKLKNLTIDRNNWSEADKQKFRKMIPNVQFEPVIDVPYWFLLPDHPVFADATGVNKKLEAKAKDDMKAAEDKAKNGQDESTSSKGESTNSESETKSARAEVALRSVALRESNSQLDVSDSKVEFGLLDSIVQGHAGKVDISRVIVRVDVLEDLGASQKEIRMISQFPFELISPNEHEFEDRLTKQLQGKSKWSH